MPRPRFKKLPEELQRGILDAALKEFADHGYEGASTNRIIESAELSKGALYYYFDDKLDLYVTVLEDVTVRLGELFGLTETWKPDGDFWEAMRDISLRTWTFTLEHRELAGLVKSIASFPPKARREGRLGELHARGRRIMANLLRAGQAQGQVRTDRPIELLVEVALGLDEAMDQWLIEHLDRLARDPAQEVVDMILDFWRRLLSPGKETQV